jgi:hypothetical protein
MPKFYVSSGNLKTIIAGGNPRRAAIASLKFLMVRGAMAQADGDKIGLEKYENISDNLSKYMRVGERGFSHNKNDTIFIVAGIEDRAIKELEKLIEEYKRKKK